MSQTDLSDVELVSEHFIVSKRSSSSKSRQTLLIGDRYRLGDKVGSGAAGSVYKAFDVKAGVFVAIKRTERRGRESESQIMNEVNLLKNLTHPNILELYDIFLTDQNMYMVMEFIESGSLANVIHNYGVIPEILAGKYVQQVLTGLTYLHSEGVIHRDIKGPNILITKSGNIKLADFGIAIPSRIEESMAEMAETGTDTGSWSCVDGSPFWMAPEVIELNQPTFKCDIWSLGALTIEILTGDPPYSDIPIMSALFKIVMDDCPELPSDTTPHCTDFLSKCFIKNPEERPTAEELLNHPWIIGDKPVEIVVEDETDEEFFGSMDEHLGKEFKKDIRRISVYNSLDLSLDMIAEEASGDITLKIDKLDIGRKKKVFLLLI
eukprot:TRINITY_DN6914_c0_g1_i1.p1 TRINITY_DN6914_c0_g1~~TRINITY_DN6914_c0_g1_i1.p1  ORF type:complete len:407 (-),score=88.27 TRINITY_DN6914_c0_g1_i1:263-1396(-)